MFASKENKTPKDLTLTARDVEFDLQREMESNRYWHSDDPVTTHFFNALQSTFPEGERFFIDSARDVQEKIGKENLSPKLQEDIETFIRQEAYHGRHHESWTKALTSLGYSHMAGFSDELKKMRLWAKKNIPAEYRLAMTSASEHFTASMAHFFIYRRPDLLRGAAKPFQQLLLYHALEELEHKAVCYDLYQESEGGYPLRMLGLAVSSFDIMKHVSERHIYLLKKDGAWNFPNRIKALNLIWGKKGIARQLIPYVIAYTKPNFHPWDTDERSMLVASFGDILNSITPKGVSANT